MCGYAGGSRNMADIIIFIIGLLLIIYLFFTVLHPEKF